MDPYFCPYHQGSRVIFHREINLDPIREDVDPVYTILKDTLGVIREIKIQKGELYIQVKIPNEANERGWSLVGIYQNHDTVGCDHYCITCNKVCPFAGIERLNRFDSLAERKPFTLTHTWGGIIDPL